MKRRKTNPRRGLLTAIAVLAVLLAVLLAVALSMDPASPDPTEPAGPTGPTPGPTDPTPGTVTNPTKPTDPGHTHRHTVTRTQAPDCTNGGYTVYTCDCGDSYFGDKTEPLGHSFETEVVEATHVAGGYTRHTCTRCGFDYTDSYTDRIPYPTDPETEPAGSMYNLVHGLQITDMGSYTGPFMEDGSDETVSNVLMIVLTNTGTELLQYAQIELSGPSGTAVFSVTTLPAGASVLLLEQTRMQDSPELEFTSAAARNVVFFPEDQTVRTDWFSFQGMEGALNVTNISGADITGDIEIYYKNMVDGQLYGGITYVARIPGGLSADETRQVMTGHFSSSESVIMFVRVAS